MKIGLDEVRRAYSDEKRRADEAEWLAAQIIRPLSMYLTVPLARMGVTANGVTWTSIVLVPVACLLLSAAGYTLQIIGASGLLLWLVLDHVDGNLARLQGHTSAYGDFLDTVSAYLLLSFFPLAMGLAAAGTESVFLPPHGWTLLGALGALGGILPRLFYQKYRSYGLGEETFKRYPIDGVGVRGRFMRAGNNLLNPSGWLLPIGAGTVVLGQERIFVAFYAVGVVALTVYILIRLCRQLRAQV